MITKNFKAVLALIIQTTSSSNSVGLLPVKQTSGITRYLKSYWNSVFPSSLSKTVQISTKDNTFGIWIGTGTTAATENDYTLESRITSGLSSSSPTETNMLDSSGNPCTEYLFTLTNNTNNDITVSEIGFVQSLGASYTQGEAGGNTFPYLLDRTVLDTPVTVPANDSAAIKYTLKTVLASS